MMDIKDKETYFEVWLDNDNAEDSGLGKKFLGIFKEYDLAVILGNSIVALWREKIVVYRMCREDGEVWMIDSSGALKLMDGGVA